jgi:hypothetical protein
MNENVSQENAAQEPAKVTATLVSGGAKLACLPKHFGRHMLRVEQTVYAFTDRFVESYRGADWDFFELSNGGFYMSPKIASPVNVVVDLNGYEGEVSADAAGIIMCLYTYSHLAFEFPEEDRIAEAYHQLRDYACDHGELGAILSAID